MKKILSLFVLLFSILSFGQSLNDYNMAVVPSKFGFQDVENQYRINSTIKAFLKQKGFEVYLSNDSSMPDGFMDYNCNKIFINVIENNSAFKTAIQVEFKDCKNNLLFSSDFGESREKEYSRAYNEALLAALKSFYKSNYKFSGKTYFDEEAQEKIKSREIVNVTESAIKVEKAESLIKVIDQISNKELILYKTSKPNVFLSVFSGKNGVIQNSGSFWQFEYLDGDKVIVEKLDIKF